MPKNWTETSIRRYRYKGVRQSFTLPGTGGLSFSVREDGSYFEWRMMRHGKTFKCHIGSVHEISLETAKERAKVYRTNVKNGLPAQQTNRQFTELTFQQAYVGYLNSLQFNDKKPSYQKVFRYRLEKYAVSPLNLSRPQNAELAKNKISDIGLSSLNEKAARSFCLFVRDNSNSHVAKTVKSHCKTIVDWAMHEVGSDLSYNPFNFNLPRTIKQKRQTYFSDAELTQLIHIFEKEPSPKRQFLLCALLTGWRNGELSQMRWNEIELDIVIPNTNERVGIWNAPASILKSNSNNRFVLTQSFLRLLDELQRLNDFVFTYGSLTKEGITIPMTPPTKRVRQILTEMGLSNSYSLHTVRHTLVTRLKEFDVPAANIDKFLGKAVREGSASHNIYAHADSLKSQLSVALEWEKHLQNLGLANSNG